MEIRLPEDVKSIISTLEEAGYEAYAVGGCVRDSLLFRIPSDWDITTSARPEQVKALFRRTVDTGIQHGTVTIMIGKEGYEVTTYRIDGEYEDCRHPKEVIFTPDLKEDLRRRDFTINAMAYNDRAGVVDLFGGIPDLEAGIIRAVGDPEARFQEDALRIMRAVRFAGQLGYEIEEETALWAGKLAGNLEKVSAERIRTELVKLAASPHPERIRTAYELGITKVILPEFDRMMETPQNNPHHCYSVGEHTIHAMCGISPEGIGEDELITLRLAMLFHDIGKPLTKTTDEEGIDHFHGHPQVSSEIARTIMRRLKFDNKRTELVTELAAYHDTYPRMTLPGVRKLIHQMGLPAFELMFSVQHADIMAQSDYQRTEKLAKQETIRSFYDQIMEAGDPLFLKDLAVDGRDLMDAGLAQGKLIGEILNRLLLWVLDDPARNRRELLIGEARRLVQDMA